MKLNNLKKAILIAFSAMVTGNIAHANLGETYQESVDRYGQPHNLTSDGATRWVLDRDHTVIARFNADNHCDFIEYNDFSGQMPDDLLTKISQNVALGDFYQEIKVPVGRFWVTKSGSVVACLTTGDNHGKGRDPISLDIATREAVEAEQASSAKPASTPVPRTNT